MKQFTTIIIVLFHSITIDANEDALNPNENNFKLNNKPINDFMNMFQNIDDKSTNLNRKKRAFDESQNTMESDDQEKMLKDQDVTRESLEDEKLKLELGQKYDQEFKNLLKMDGLHLDQAVVDQLNKSLVQMFTDTMKETMNRFTLKHEYPRYVMHKDFEKAIGTFQIEYRRKAAEWFKKISRELPNMLVNADYKEIESPKGKEIYQSLVNHKCKVLRRALRSYINHHYKRMEFEYMNRVLNPVILSIPRNRMQGVNKTMNGP